MLSAILSSNFWRRIFYVIRRRHQLMANDSKLLCAFGVIADVHYADTDDGMNHSRTVDRYYRRSLELVKAAVRDWSTSQWRAEFVLQMGDLIDGLNSRLVA